MILDSDEIIQFQPIRMLRGHVLGLIWTCLNAVVNFYWFICQISVKSGHSEGTFEGILLSTGLKILQNSCYFLVTFKHRSGVGNRL